MAEKEVINIDELLTEIAAKNLLLDDDATLETRNWDSYDFHDCAVWSIKQALIDAFMLGAKMGLQEGTNNAKV